MIKYFKLYEDEKFEDIITYTDSLIEEENIQKYLLIKAKSYASVNDIFSAKVELQKIIINSSDEEIKKYAVAIT